MKNLTIPRLLWWRLLTELKKRGGGHRESGAFLLSKAGNSKICGFLCYDDLDPHSLDSGIIIFHGEGYIPLWEHCRKNNLCVTADVHTHPGHWTNQSQSDRTNPMISLPEHVAMIVPDYAQNNWRGLQGVGIHQYLGNHRWKSWKPKSGRVCLSLL